MKKEKTNIGCNDAISGANPELITDADASAEQNMDVSILRSDVAIADKFIRKVIRYVNPNAKRDAAEALGSILMTIDRINAIDPDEETVKGRFVVEDYQHLPVFDKFITWKHLTLSNDYTKATDLKVVRQLVADHPDACSVLSPIAYIDAQRALMKLFNPKYGTLNGAKAVEKINTILDHTVASRVAYIDNGVAYYNSDDMDVTIHGCMVKPYKRMSIAENAVANDIATEMLNSLIADSKNISN